MLSVLWFNQDFQCSWSDISIQDVGFYLSSSQCGILGPKQLHGQYMQVPPAINWDSSLNRSNSRVILTKQSHLLLSSPRLCRLIRTLISDDSAEAWITCSYAHPSCPALHIKGVPLLNYFLHRRWMQALDINHSMILAESFNMFVVVTLGQARFFLNYFTLSNPKC